jgi:hypothetical protein
MAEKRVSVRLSAVGGRQVRAELEGVGEADTRGFGRLSREMELANQRLAAFSGRVQVVSAAAVAAATAAGVAMIRSSLETVDAQAKLAQSLGTAVASIQTLERAGELAGVAMSGIEQATKDLTRRLSQAAAGAGPGAAALTRLNLSAEELLRLPLDERVGHINQAITDFVPAAERAAVAGQLFGEEGSIAMARIDTATLRQATEDVRAFGVVVSEQDADQIERTNDAISRLGLIWRGLSNQLAVAAAPALEAVADALASLTRTTGPMGSAIQLLFEQIGRLASYAGSVAAFMAGRWVAGLAAAALSVRGLATALVLLRGALIRTGIGALVVAAGELVYQFGRLASSAGGFGEAMTLLGDVASEVWQRIALGGEALGLSLGSVWAAVEAGWLSVLQSIQKTWADFLHQLARGVDGLIGMEAVTLKLSGAAINAGSAYYAMALAADEARERSDTLAASASAATSAAMAPLKSLQALRNAASVSREQTKRPGSSTDVSASLAETVSTNSGQASGDQAVPSSPADQSLGQTGRETASAWQDVNTTFDQSKEIVRGLAGDIIGPLQQALKQGERGWRTFAGAVAGIAQNLANRLIEHAFKPIEDALVRALSPSASNSGWLSGVLGSLAGSFSYGGAFDRYGEVTAFARGGVVSQPTLFPFARGIGLMGEAGPEAILPLRRGAGGRLGVEATNTKPAEPPAMRIINVLDPAIVGDYLATPAGERAIVNVIRRNRGALSA